MKFRGPGASLNPAREAARAQARALAPGLPRARGSASHVIGDWQLSQDARGALVALHLPTGQEQVVLHPPEPPADEIAGTEEEGSP